MLKIENVTVRYGSVTALESVDITAGNGVLALLGPNGAGKTTLLSVLAGIRTPHSGTVTFGSNRPRKVGYLLQAFDLAPGLTVSETIRYAAWCNRIERKNLDAAIRYSLDVVELNDMADRRVRTLSGGQRQRLGLAASIAHRPQLFLLDEPTVGLDPDQRVSFRRYLDKIGADACVVLATHLLEDVRLVADQVVVLDAAEVRFDGSLQELVDLGTTSRVSGSPASDLEAGYRAAIAKPRRDD